LISFFLLLDYFYKSTARLRITDLVMLILCVKRERSLEWGGVIVTPTHSWIERWALFMIKMSTNNFFHSFFTIVASHFAGAVPLLGGLNSFLGAPSSLERASVWKTLRLLRAPLKFSCET